jgi:hypothetical protein
VSSPWATARSSRRWPASPAGPGLQPILCFRLLIAFGRPTDAPADLVPRELVLFPRADILGAALMPVETAFATLQALTQARLTGRVINEHDRHFGGTCDVIRQLEYKPDDPFVTRRI